MSHCKQAKARAGLTLVEMLVSVALTLMVVFALVRVFELLGNNVAEGRATIEVSGNLRSAAQLLRDDLGGLTVTTLPPRSPDAAEGFFETVDGPETDQTQLVVRGTNIQLARMNDLNVMQDLEGDGFVDSSAVLGYDTSVGDTDDILAFTSRRAPDRPFTGMITDLRIRSKTGVIPGFLPAAPTAILQSTEAEIVWWVQTERNVQSNIQVLQGMTVSQQLANSVSAAANRMDLVQRYPNAVGTPGADDYFPGTPVRSLHRRVLLIRPDLDLSDVVLNSKDELDTFLSNNDISVIVERNGSSFTVRPNSLSTLAVRHNRSFRHSHRAPPSSLARWRLTRLDDIRELGVLTANNLLLRQAAMKDMILPHQLFQKGGGTTMMLRRSKDVVLSDVLAFDVQVWDPEAPLRMSSQATTLTPSDPGYLYPFPQPSTGMPTGAFVDLGYAVPPKSSRNWPTDVTTLWPAGLSSGFFGGGGHVKSFLPVNPSKSDRLSAVYGTWCAEYEADGVDQDESGLADQGTNGLDDNNQFGVDDPTEQEMSPPYPHPLRGISVKLRVMDFSTRQVRQTSIAIDFLPE